MSDTWQLRVYEQNERICTADLTGPAELGRQTSIEEPLYVPRLTAGRHRVAIAPKDERAISRQQILIEPLPGGGFRVTRAQDRSPGRPILPV